MTMYNSSGKWLIIALSLILIGGIFFVGIMTVLGWDFTKLSTVKYETDTHEINEEFSGISFDTNTADISFELSEDGKCKVVCYEQKNVKSSVVVSDGVLKIKTVDSRKWYEHIGINFQKSKITVYLPKSEYASLNIDESTGDINIPSSFKFGSIDLSLSTGDINCAASAEGKIKISATTGDVTITGISAESLEISVTTGDVTVSEITCGDVKIDLSTGKTKLTDISCRNIETEGSTGSISLNRVIALQGLKIERDTGNVSFTDCDAAEVFIETDTGDVKGSFLTDKIIFAETDTGDIDVPKLSSGGRCEISTDTGDIEISISHN